MKYLYSVFIVISLLINLPAYGDERGVDFINANEKRVALVIGNGDYKFSPLTNPKNDAESMAEALGRCGFDVHKLVNVNRQEMRNAIREFGSNLKKSGVGLFYYAGHGIQVKGENYLIPVNVDVKNEYEVEDECIKMSCVLRAMEDAGNRLNIVILDACRNNPFKRSFRSSTRGLARMDAPAGSYIAFATAPGSVAADGTGKNGLYTSKLLEFMLSPGLSIEQVFKKVRIAVLEATNKEQVPWESSSLTGNFYFININLGTIPSETKKTKFTPPKSTKSYHFLISQNNKSEYQKIDNRFTIEDDFTIYDSFLKKRWKLNDSDIIYTLDEAKEYCKNIEGNYRLPTESELKSLITKERDKEYNINIATDFFQINSRTTKYWTNSSGFLGKYIYIDFKNGVSRRISKTNYCAFFAISD